MYPNNNTGLMQASPVVFSTRTTTPLKPGNPITRRNKLKAFAGAVMTAVTSLVAFAVSAQTPINSSLTCTRPVTATTSCVDGYFANGWTSGDQYWTYSLNTSGFEDISMDFSNRSSGTGPKKGLVYHKLNASAAEVLFDSFTVSTTSCGTALIELPEACEGQENLRIIVRMKDATAAGGTHRMPINGVFTGQGSACSGTPVAGMVNSSVDAVCGSGNVSLSLSGAASGSGMTYQWESSADGSTWTAISGATAVTYSTMVSGTTYFRVVTSCGSGDAVSPAKQITVHALPAVAGIDNVPAGPLLIGATADLDNTTPGGEWSSSNTSVITVDPVTGVITAVNGGAAFITYTVESLATGCLGAESVLINVIWPNTLALYSGYNGISTDVVTVSGASVSGLSTQNFLNLDTPSTPCSRGGLSGLNIAPAVTAFNAATGPYLSYTVTSDPGKVLNVNRIQASTRQSDSGATQARIAYRINGGSWIDEERNVNQNVGGSCGANSTVWDFTKSGANPTHNGIETIGVAVFPYAPATQYGTFQLNSLEIYGSVTDDTPCAGTPDGGVITPSSVSICDSGSRWLNHAGTAGTGIEYQWEVSSDGTATWSPIAGATGATYNTGMLYAPTVGLNTLYYRVKTTCTASGNTAYSALDTVRVVNTGDAGSIILDPEPSGDFLKVGEPVTFMNEDWETGYWRSNDTSVLSIDSATGYAMPNIPGDAVVSYILPVGGCIARATKTVDVVYPNTIAAYIGKNGNSSAIIPATGYVVTPLVNNGFDTTSRCGSGGLSGLKNDGVASYSPSGAHVSFSLTVGGLSSGTLDINEFYATVRKSNSGPRKVTLAYKVVGRDIDWVDDLTEHEVEADGCGYSADVIRFDQNAIQLPDDLVNGDVVEFAIFAYDATAFGGTFQVNSINIVAAGSPEVLNGSVENPSGLQDITADHVEVYPNPVTNMLNINAQETVNVRIMGIDGRRLIEANNTSAVDVSNLTAGMYFIQIYRASDNSLLKTTRFSKL